MDDRVLGVFTSHHNSDPPNHPVDWRRLYAAAYRFAYIKATDWLGGKPWTDPAFERDWQEAQAAGFLVGAMMYHQPSVNPKIQCAHFLDTMAKFGHGHLPYNVDIEQRPFPGRSLRDDLSTLFAYLSLHGLKRAGPYSRAEFWRSFVSPFTFQASAVFHLAQWNLRAHEPDLFPGTDHWDFWQFECKANRWRHMKAPGISSQACISRYNGTFEQLTKWLNLDPLPPVFWPVNLSSAERASILAIADRIRSP